MLECALWIHRERLCCKSVFPIYENMTISFENMTIIWHGQSLCDLAALAQVCATLTVQNPPWLVSTDPCSPHPSQGKQHCPDYTITKRSKPGDSQQKTIWWHLRAVGYSGDDRHGCYLQTVNGLAGLGPSACSTGRGTLGCCGWCNDDVPHGSSETKGTLKIHALLSCLQGTEQLC